MTGGRRPGIRALGAAMIMLLLASTCVFAAGTTTDSHHAQEVTVTTASGPVSIRLFSGQRDGRRPAVIILHGRQGLGRFAAAYTRYADALAAAGIDAVLVSYYDAADLELMNAADPDARQRYFSGHLQQWSSRVRDVVSFVAQREDFSGKLGLLGFSNGGFLAVATSASDQRVNALVVFYAGIAGEQTGPSHLPPLLALHGDADRNVPLSSGKALVERAKMLGGEAELVVYPGADHGFDFDASRPDSADALARTMEFLKQRLQ